MKKNLLSVLLSTAMVASMLVGCGSQNAAAPAADTAKEEVADEAGLKLSTEKQDMFPDTTNDPGTVAKVREAAESLDFAVSELEEPIRSSEDFGWYQKKCPGAMIFIGNGRDWPQIHTSTYDFNDRILETAAELMYELVK